MKTTDLERDKISLDLFLCGQSVCLMGKDGGAKHVPLSEYLRQKPSENAKGFDSETKAFD